MIREVDSQPQYESPATAAGEQGATPGAQMSSSGATQFRAGVGGGCSRVAQRLRSRGRGAAADRGVTAPLRIRTGSSEASSSLSLDHRKTTVKTTAQYNLLGPRDSGGSVCTCDSPTRQRVPNRLKELLGIMYGCFTVDPDLADLTFHMQRLQP